MMERKNKEMRRKNIANSWSVEIPFFTKVLGIPQGSPRDSIFFVFSFSILTAALFKMACSRNALPSLVASFGEREVSDEIREIFEICKNGDVSKVRRYITNGLDLNIRDTAGRKSSPLHFAAG